MTDQLEFDLLRRTCSAALEHFVSKARETDRRMQQLTLPVSLEMARQFTSQRRAEVDACEEYLVVSNHLAAFVQQHLYQIGRAHV